MILRIISIYLTVIIDVLSDIKKPERYLKKSTMFSLALVSFLYIFTNIAYLFVVPRDEAIASGTRMAALFFDKACSYSNSHPFRFLTVLLDLW